MTYLKTLAALTLATLATTAFALATPVAFAKPATESPASNGASAPKQDLRSPDAKDAAKSGTAKTPDKQEPKGVFPRPQGPPTWPTDPDPIPAAPQSSIAIDDGSGGIPAVLLVGAGSVLLLGAAVGVARMRRAVRAV